MRWRRGHKSAHVEDRRGARGGKLAFGGVGALIVVLVGAYFGVDVSALLSGGSRGAAKEDPIPPEKDNEREVVEFVSSVYDHIQELWTAELGDRYRPATLVLYRRGTPTGCGYGRSAIGPFYCAADEKAYVDLSFFRDLKRRYKAPGDFAQVYVLAHEIGHHVQHLDGTSARVRKARKRLDEARGNRESVKLELQADCYAGAFASWAETKGLLEVGDVDEALSAAAAIGDDALQKKSGGEVQPESWTHGSSQQRMRWFERGRRRGELEDCDTFSSSSL